MPTSLPHLKNNLVFTTSRFAATTPRRVLKTAIPALRKIIRGHWCGSWANGIELILATAASVTVSGFYTGNLGIGVASLTSLGTDFTIVGADTSGNQTNY